MSTSLVAGERTRTSTCQYCMAQAFE